MNSFALRLSFITFVSVLLSGCATFGPQNKTAQVAEPGWIHLFDGTSLEGWRGYNGESMPSGWAIVDEALVFDKAFLTEAEREEKTAWSSSLIHRQLKLSTMLNLVDGVKVGRWNWVRSEDVDAGLSIFAKLWWSNEIRPYQHGQNGDDSSYHEDFADRENAAKIRDLSRRSNISFPFLYVKSLTNSYGIDRYYEKHLEVAAIDENACCKLIPYPDETVFVRICSCSVAKF